MEIIRPDRENIQGAVRTALAVLLEGGVIAYPTETFYGLGAKFDLEGPLRRLYEIKRRPREKAMPVIIGELPMLSAIVAQEWLEGVPPSVLSLMEEFWPGPLTLLLPAREGLSAYLTADTGLIAVRIPGESFALDLAKNCAASYRKAKPEVRKMWNQAFFRTIRVQDGTIADSTYEEPFASLLGSHKGSMVEVGVREFTR